MPTDRELLDRAHQWIAPYWNAEHLRRTLDWLFILEPQASLALRLAALTHDMERHFPGPDSPRLNVQRGIPDRLYEEQHQKRSARIVAAWLTEQEADPALVEAVRDLVAVHEWGAGRKLTCCRRPTHLASSRSTLIASSAVGLPVSRASRPSSLPSISAIWRSGSGSPEPASLQSRSSALHWPGCKSKR